MATIQFNGIYWGIEKRTPCFRFPAAPAALIQRAVCVWDNTSSRKDCGRARALNSNRARASHIKGRTITRASQALTHNLFGLTVFNNERTLHVVHRFDEYQHFQRTLLYSSVFVYEIDFPQALTRGFPWQLSNPQARAAFHSRAGHLMARSWAAKPH